MPYPLNRRLVDPSASLDVVEKKKFAHAGN
jgi:hypothetical protein